MIWLNRNRTKNIKQKSKGRMAFEECQQGRANAFHSNEDFFLYFSFHFNATTLLCIYVYADPSYNGHKVYIYNVKREGFEGGAAKLEVFSFLGLREAKQLLCYIFLPGYYACVHAYRHSLQVQKSGSHTHAVF